MKIHWLTFSLYLLLLSIAPCGDSAECSNVSASSFFNTSEDHHDHANHQHESEHCSPFCHCSCCGINMVFLENYFSINRPLIGFFLAKSQAIYAGFFISEIFFNIWQPPKYLFN